MSLGIFPLNLQLIFKNSCVFKYCLKKMAQRSAPLNRLPQAQRYQFILFFLFTVVAILRMYISVDQTNFVSNLSALFSGYSNRYHHSGIYHFDNSLVRLLIAVVLPLQLNKSWLIHYNVHVFLKKKEN